MRTFQQQRRQQKQQKSMQGQEKTQLILHKLEFTQSMSLQIPWECSIQQRLLQCISLST